MSVLIEKFSEGFRTRAADGQPISDAIPEAAATIARAIHREDAAEYHDGPTGLMGMFEAELRQHGMADGFVDCLMEWAESGCDGDFVDVWRVERERDDG